MWPKEASSLSAPAPASDGKATSTILTALNPPITTRAQFPIIQIYPSGDKPTKPRGEQWQTKEMSAEDRDPDPDDELAVLIAFLGALEDRNDAEAKRIFETMPAEM